MYGTPKDISLSDSIQANDDESMTAIILKYILYKNLSNSGESSTNYSTQRPGT